MEKKLYLLRPKENLVNSPWKPWYDKTFGFVVRAENETEARRIAHEKGADENRDGNIPWLDKKLSTCKELTEKGESEVIIEDHASA